MLFETLPKSQCSIPIREDKLALERIVAEVELEDVGLEQYAKEVKLDSGDLDNVVKEVLRKVESQDDSMDQVLDETFVEVVLESGLGNEVVREDGSVWVDLGIVCKNGFEPALGTQILWGFVIDVPQNACDREHKCEYP